MTTTVLPIPAQDGFNVWLPGRVRFAADTQVIPHATGVTLRRNEITLSIMLSPAARDGLITALSDDGDGMPTTSLSTTWRQLLERLAGSGMLTDATPPAAGLSALDALAVVLDRVYTENVTAFQGDGALDRLIAGHADQPTAVRWLVENYHYTKSAGYHVAPVLQHGMEPAEHALWQRFLKDESWHWRIYRPAMAQFGLTFSDLDVQPPALATQNFIETLHTISHTGPVAYAAAMIFIEKPPAWPTLDDDPLFAGLMRHYGFSRAAIRPLWWHATENLTAGHSALGAVVISNRRVISRSDLDAALDAVTAVIHAVRDWHEGVLAECF